MYYNVFKVKNYSKINRIMTNKKYLKNGLNELWPEMLSWGLTGFGIVSVTYLNKLKK